MANIFEQFNNCLKNKDYQESLGFNSFMFCRFLSSSPQTLQLANILNQLYKNLDDKSQYNIVRYIPNKPSFIKFINKDVNVNNPEIERIINKYKVNREKAIEYLKDLKLNFKC